MTDYARSFAPIAPVCLSCGEPLPESRAKTRRYCSASCRTTAYNLRVAERLAPLRAARTSELPSWVSTPSGEVPVLSQTRAALKEIGATLAALAHRVEAEESALRRDLDRVRARVSKHQGLERELAQTRHHLAEREAELRQLRQMLAERESRPPPASDAQPTPPPTALTTFPSLSVPERLLDGIALLTHQLDFVRRFARAQAQRGESEVVTGFAVGLDLIHAHLCAATTKLDALLSSPDAVVPPAALRWTLVHDILPAFDDLYRCVRALRGSASSQRIDSLCEAVEWVFACFVGVLERRGVVLLYPLGSPFNPHEHEASALVENAALPPGSVADVIHVGVGLDGVLLRPARVVVVAARSVASSP
ncbi:MAG: nucleotide exchange factor GrpE [Myxococcales bacterium]|nr:nucleotide exchange factor GrpE [Myxococcales bacterium]